MSEVIKLKKGLDIPIMGKPDTVTYQADLPKFFALKPTDFHSVTPKMELKPGEKVKAGTVLFHDKNRPELKFTSPVSGELIAVNRGERRKILEVVVQSDGDFQREDFGKSDISKISREQAIEKMLASGAWPFIRQRPYDIIANPSDTPKALFISGFDTSPLAPDYDFILSGKEKEFQAGIDVLMKLSNDKVHIGISNDSASKLYKSLKGVELHEFQGPHPSGNVGVQLHHVMPVCKGDVVWVTRPQDVLTIGKLFTDGVYDVSRIVVVAGSEVKKRGYYNSIAGASVEPLVKNNVTQDNVRYISGDVLTGTQITANGYLGFYHSQITVIPEGNYFEFMGWALPGIGKYSVTRTYFSWLSKNKEYKLDSNQHGGKRAFVISGQYEKVLPMDILPEFLFKAIITEDIDKMEQLGIYEVVEEDVALCEFVDTSKIEIQKIVRDGIELMIKEVG